MLLSPNSVLVPDQAGRLKESLRNALHGNGRTRPAHDAVRLPTQKTPHVG